MPNQNYNENLIFNLNNQLNIKIQTEISFETIPFHATFLLPHVKDALIAIFSFFPLLLALQILIYLYSFTLQILIYLFFFPFFSTFFLTFLIVFFPFFLIFFVIFLSTLFLNH